MVVFVVSVLLSAASHARRGGVAAAVVDCQRVLIHEFPMARLTWSHLPGDTPIKISQIAEIDKTIDKVTYCAPTICCLLPDYSSSSGSGIIVVYTMRSSRSDAGDRDTHTLSVL